MQDHEPKLQIAQIVPSTEAEGPGTRFAIWFQGCPLRCPGCCNPEFLPFHGGQTQTLSSLLKMIDSTPNIEGITLLGGEPFAHAESAAPLAESVQKRGLSVMIFSGYILAELQSRTDIATQQLLANTDILVDGPYLRERPDTSRRWIGSTNQTVHFLSRRYCPNDPCWQKPNTLEIRVDRAGISINGFPAIQAQGLWKGWARKSGRLNQ